MIKRLISYYRNYLKLNFLGLLFLVLAVVAVTVIPYLIKTLIDQGLKGKQYDLIAPMCLAILGIALARGIFIYFRDRIFHTISQKVVYDFRLQLFDKLQSLPFSFYDKESTGKLMNRFTGDLNAVREFVINGQILSVEGIIQFVLSLVFMFSMSAKLSLSLFIILPFIYLNTSAVSKKLFVAFQRVRTAFENLMSYVQENISGIRVVKVFGRENEEKKNFKKHADEYKDANINVIEIRANHNPLSSLIVDLASILVFCFGGILAITNQITIGELVAFNSYIFMFMGPINNINNLVNQSQNATTSLEKIFTVLDTEPDIKNVENPYEPDTVNGAIKFEKVFFKYQSDYILSNINIDIKPGQIVGIMGATGSGKTSLINMISRFYDTTKGVVSVDGVDIRQYNLYHLRKNIGVILQETFLFSDTIENNIKFGRTEATKAEVIQAAKIADAHEFIEKLPNGYQTKIGERGMGLSGGQKQRLAIARAVLFNPKILILDDATSSVDMDTEHNIQSTLNSVMKDRTTIIIAHRISAVKNADQIICMESGRVIEQGVHDTLLLEKGYYYKTFIQQYGDMEVESDG
ncbi:MAG: ABC transporter ATP-binding protein [Clostridia bacterium]|nr:ABC transporter ATP-binding protein [Clostridia bacterium]